MCRKLVLFAAAFLIFCVQTNAQDEPNLMGYWNFDDGTAGDLSGNGNNGTFVGFAGLNNDPAWAFGGTGMSLDLNYQNRNTDWVEIPHSDSLNITHELTILTWIRSDDIENNDGMVTKGKTRASWSLRFNITNGLRFNANEGFNLDDPNDPNFAPGAIGSGDRQSMLEVSEANEPAGIDWSFVGVISDTKSLSFILNLEEERLPAAYIFAELNEPLILGSYLPDGDYFNGLMDEVRIYNRALSRREVIAISGLAEKPFEPEPVDGAVGVTTGTLSWGSIEGTDKLYLGTDPGALALVSEDAAGTYTIEEIVTGQQYFWRVDVATAEGLVTSDVWTFTVAANEVSNPSPSVGAEFVGVDGISLSWSPAFGATAYDVYFGTAADALEPLGQVTQTSYEDPNRTMVSETLHYWHVDAAKNGELVAGPVWSFKTMPVFTVEEALAAWYKFELGEGTLAVDWTRKGNEGVLVGNTKWVKEGYSGGALEFDGAADYVEIPRVVQDDWTIMLWLRTDNLQQSWPGRLGTVGRARNGVGLVDGDAGSTVENFVLSLNGDQIVANCMAAGQGDGDALASNARITSTDWHHAAWTRIAATGDMALFIDGLPDNSGQNNKWIGTKDAQDFIWIAGLQFGNRQQYLEGRLDEIKFFSRVLNEAEIKEEMRPDKRLAFSPQPVPGSLLDQEVPVTLAWEPGEGATAHNVYLGTNKDDLPLVSAALNATQYDAGLLAPGTYYWQIGEIQTDGAEVKGDFWDFNVAGYIVVDDFEDYNDYPPDEIFSTWKDGWGIPTNGALVAHPEPPFAETTIVHGGMQSMPYYYDNSAGYSEATRMLVSGRDWTRNGVAVLSLWFRGLRATVGSFVEAPAGTYTLTASGADIWNQADEFHFAYKELSGPGSIIAKVESVSNTHNWAKAGVMIRDTLNADSAQAMMVVSAAQGVSFQRRTIAGESTTKTDQAGITAPYWVKIERDIGGIVTASYSADGTTWTQLGSEPIVMNIPMYIGLALTAHNTEATCEAKFSNVQIAGTVSPQWANQDIGIINNDPEPMYVAIANSTGPAAVVYHDDSNATQINSWTEWPIELKRFADQGVNLTSVEKVSLGFGDRNNPQAGGSGLMYFDDIRLYPPVTTEGE